MDLNVAEPSYDVPLWNETRWNGCWSPDAGVGVYIHAGRFRRNLDLWWCQVVAYLPGEQLCLDRLWGRNHSKAGVRIGGFDLSMTEDGWTSSLEGVGQLTSIEELSRGPRGASAPSRSLSWEITASPAAPVWDMYANWTGPALNHGDAHIQQGYTTTGTLTVDGEEWPLTGVGFKDHSSGPRKIGDWTGHRYFMIVTEEWTAHVGVMDDADYVPGQAWGTFIRDGKFFDITRLSMEPLEDARGGPVHGTLEFEASNGESFRFEAELIHALPMTVSEQNDNINGVDWDLDGNPLVLIEGKGKLTASDGTVAYCFHERSRRRDVVPRPS